MASVCSERTKCFENGIIAVLLWHDGPAGIPDHLLVKSPKDAILYLWRFPQPVVASGIAPSEV